LRDELLEIQREGVQEVQRRLETAVGPVPLPIRSYQRAYEREFHRGFTASSRAELVRRALRSRVVYVGDYHSLPASVDLALHLLKQLLRAGRRVSLALEMFRSADQPHLDALSRGALDEQALFERTGFLRRWGFDGRSCRDLLRFARAHQVPLLALDRDDPDATLEERDRCAAERLARRLRRRPEESALVYCGDFHLARRHLPDRVDRLLAASGRPAPRLIVHQNNDRIYWVLAERRLEQHLQVVRLSNDSYCAVTATPLQKLHSYLAWEECRDPGDEAERALAAEIARLGKLVARFLHVSAVPLRQLRVHAGALPDLVPHLPDGDVAGRERLRSGRPVRTAGRTVLLPDATPEALAEAAGLVLREGPRRRPGGASARFHEEVLAEGAAFLASRVVDHKRPCRSPRDFARFLARHRAGRLDEQAARFRDRARAVLAQLRHEARGASRPGPALRQPAALRGAVARALGRILADRLFRRLLSDHVGVGVAQLLFRTAGDPEARYRRLRGRIE
jgi:hypothetical protein